MKEKAPLSHEVLCFQVLDFETSNSKISSFPKTTLLQREPFQILNLRSRNQICGKLLLSVLEKHNTSEEAVSHNVLYHQHLPIIRLPRFYANNYFE